jgi:chorismate mutase/prephenate dehydratase
VSEADPHVEELRGRIAARDLALLEAVNARLELVAELKAYKDANGIAFLDPDREARLVAELQRANRGPLSEEGVRHLIEEVLALTKRELSR